MAETRGPMSGTGSFASFANVTGTSASLIGRSGSSAFRLSTSADVAHGLVLLFGIGGRNGIHAEAECLLRVVRVVSVTRVACPLCPPIATEERTSIYVCEGR